MPPVLLIRSVSLQQLDKNLPAILDRFPGAEIHLLTHPHSLDLCRKYTAVARCLSYGTRKSFSPLHRPASAASTRYAAVLVPVSNRSGAGFLNVLLLAARFHPAPVFLCNLASEIRPVSRLEILRQAVRSVVFSGLALLGSLPVCLLALPWLIVNLAFFKGPKQNPPGTPGRSPESAGNPGGPPQKDFR